MKRNRGIDLVKCIAMFLIVLNHVVMTIGSIGRGDLFPDEMFYDLNYSTGSINLFIMIMLRFLGALGNDIFLICSVWFLRNSKTNDNRKIIKIIFE